MLKNTAGRASPCGFRRFRFFSGKGGSGKTTCAAAAALAAADAGGRVLLLSTDPAHSLGDALGAPLGPEPARVLGPAGELWAAEIAAGAALGRWLAARRPALELAAERGSYLDAEDVRALFDLTPPGADELGGLLETVRLAEATGCPEVVVDTAPTAHTLRLLAVPEMLAGLAAAFADLQVRHQVVAETLGGPYHPDAGDRAVEELAAQARGLDEMLRDGRRASFVWVLLPEALAVAESEDALAALAGAGVAVEEVVINRVLAGRAGTCARCRRRLEGEREAIAAARRALGGRPLRLLPEAGEEPRGLAALRTIGAALAAPGRGAALARTGAGRRSARAGRGAEGEPADGSGVPAWVEALGGQRLLLFGGKGGAGKTTCAATAALAIAARWPGEPVLLVSTDPAHSLADVLVAPLDDAERPVAGAPPNLRARELDAPAVLARWRRGRREALEEVLAGWTGQPAAFGGGASDRASGGGASGRAFGGGASGRAFGGGASGRASGGGASGSGASGRMSEAADLPAPADDSAPGDNSAATALLDLVPTGLDELVGVLALVEAVFGEEGEGGYARVVVDTAPTGHALRLLAMPELALTWDHALLSLLLKYREVAAPGELAEELVSLSRRLKRFSALLRDPALCGFVAVVRPSELPCQETERLLVGLGELGIETGALVVNAVTPGGGPGAAGGPPPDGAHGVVDGGSEVARGPALGADPQPAAGGASSPPCPRCARRAAAEAPHLARLRALARAEGRRCAMILAPAEFPPPRGARRLGEWGQSWEVDRS